MPKSGAFRRMTGSPFRADIAFAVSIGIAVVIQGRQEDCSCRTCFGSTYST